MCFRTVMNKYLNEYKYQNASTSDLWACLGEASGKPVPVVMAIWTEQMGFPVLTVDSKQVCYLISGRGLC